MRAPLIAVQPFALSAARRSPFAASSRWRAAAAERPARPITIAVLTSPPRAGEEGPRACDGGRSRGGRDDSQRAVLELRRSRAQVHHPRAEDLSRGRERRGRDLVQCELRRRSGFQARRARDDLGSRVEPHDDLRDLFDAGRAARRHEHGASAALPRPVERSPDEPRHRARGDADDEIPAPRAARPPDAVLIVVLRSLARAEHRAAAAGDDGLHPLRVGPERRRQLRRLDDREPAARAGPEEEARAPGPERRRERLRRPHDLAPRAAQRREHAPVLRLHERDHARDPQPVEPRGLRVGGFGRELLPDSSSRSGLIEV